MPKLNYWLGGAALLGSLVVGEAVALAAPAQCFRNGCAPDERDARGCCSFSAGALPPATRQVSAARRAPSELAPCVNGQVRNADTQQHCCWPSQGWVTGEARCTGTPKCPTGLAARGETCVNDLRASRVTLRSEPCLVDADGKAPLDVAILIGDLPVVTKSGGSVVSSLNKSRLVVLEGATGQTLEWGPEYEPQATLMCGDPNWVVVDNPEGRLDIQPAGSLSERSFFPLSGRVSAYAPGIGCLALQTGLHQDDITNVSFDPVATTCELEPYRRYYVGKASADEAKRSGVAPGTLSWLAFDTVNWQSGDPKRQEVVGDSGRLFGVIHDAIDYYKTPPTLVGRLPNGSQWSTTLRFNGTAVADAGATVVVWALDRADMTAAYVMGVDASTGAERYAKRQKPTIGFSQLRSLRYNGRLVLADLDLDGLYAYEPTTGDRKWGVGRVEWEQP